MENRPLLLSSYVDVSPSEKTDLYGYMKASIDFASKMTLDSIDIDIDRIADLFCEDMVAELTKVKKYAKKKNVKVGLSHLKEPIRNLVTEADLDDAVAKIQSYVDMLSILEVKYLALDIVSPVLPKYAIDREKMKRLDLAYLTPIVKYAKEKDVEILLKNAHISYEIEKHSATPFILRRNNLTAKEVVELADALCIGICWDTGYANISNITLQSEALDYIGDRLKAVVVNDNYAYQDERVVPYHGSVNWKDFMAGLKNIGYKGYLNFGVDSSRVPSKVKEFHCAHLVATAEQLLGIMA